MKSVQRARNLELLLKNNDWQEIRGFASPGEYERFVNYIEALVASGDANEIPSDPAYGVGEIDGGRWFINKNTNRTWRLVEPDFPFRGLWEIVTQEP